MARHSASKPGRGTSPTPKRRATGGRAPSATAEAARHDALEHGRAVDNGRAASHGKATANGNGAGKAAPALAAPGGGTVPRAAPRSPLLAGLGRALRALRRRDVITRQALAERSGLSLRFLAQLEAGEGNVSISKLEALAGAFGLSAPALLAAAYGAAQPGESRPALLAEITARLLAVPAMQLEGVLRGLEAMPRDGRAGGPPASLVALVGLRGAGKSTLGPLLAQRLGLPFLEMDELIAEQSGMALKEIFELHGESYYREAERRALASLISQRRRAVVAVSGGIVTDPAALDLLRRYTRLIWLKAKPEQYMARVEAQGDYRPMRNRPNAMNELKGLLRERDPLYRQAHAIVDTGAGDAAASLAALVSAVGTVAPASAAR